MVEELPGFDTPKNNFAGEQKKCRKPGRSIRRPEKACIRILKKQ
jgi:hypothetical protein